jgi:recombination protein RecT
MTTTAMEKAQASLDKRRGGGGQGQQVHQLLERAKNQISMALPKHLNADRMVRVAWGVISRTPDLLRCEATSLVRAVIQAAELGLEPSNVMGHCYLVPFKNQATLMIGYRGFIELAARAGKARFRPARVVYDCDTFQWHDGLEQSLTWVPGDRTSSSRPTHVFVVVDFANGLPPMMEVMTYSEIERIRKTSKMPNGPGWRDNWEEMAKKTVVRRMAKYVPMSPELQRAASSDEAIEMTAAVVDDGINVGEIVEEFGEPVTEPETVDQDGVVQ